MKVFKSSINNKSASFKTNKRAMFELVKELNSYLKLSKIQGSEFALKKLNKMENHYLEIKLQSF